MNNANNANAVGLSSIASLSLHAMRMLPMLALAGFTAGAVAATGTDVTFIDGGYAEMCSSVAHNLDNARPIALTGSRMSIAPLQICTLAIEDRATLPADLAASYNNRGVLLFDQGKLQEALADYDAAIAVSGTLAAAHINRAYTLIAMERWEDSIASFDRGIELGAPEPARAYFNRGVAHEEVGHVREAYYDYKLASELNPEWEEPKRELERFTVR